MPRFNIAAPTLIICTSAIFCLTASAQAPIDPNDPRLSEADVELRKRLVPLIPSFREALLSDNIEAQRATLAVIADIPPALAAGTNLSEVMTAFLQKDHKDPEIIALGLRSFGKSVPDAPDIGKVCGKHGRSKEIAIRRANAEALAGLVANSTPSARSLANAMYFYDVCKQALPLLGVSLEDGDPVTQRHAVGGIQSCARIVNDLIKFDNSAGPDEARERFKSLAPVIEALAVEAPKSKTTLASSDASTRIAAARALDSLAVLRRTIMNHRDLPGKDPFNANWLTLKPALEARILDQDPAVRLAIVEAIESLGDAIEARELMRLASKDSSVYVRWATARALGRTASGQTDAKATADDVAALTQLIGDKDLDVRGAAIAAVAKYGPAAKSAASAVISAAGRGDIEPRVSAVNTMGAIETDAAASIPVLIAGLQNSDDRLRRASALGLVRFGPEAKAALPELRRALQSADMELRLAAAEAILAIERTRRFKDL